MNSKGVFLMLDEILLNEEKPSLKINQLKNKEFFIKSDFDILNKLSDIPQDKIFHPEGNVWNHTEMVVDYAAKFKKYAEDKRKFMWAALLHDVGKITTTKWLRGKYRSYNHDTEGADKVFNLICKNINDNNLAISIQNIVRYHMHHIYISKNLPFSDIQGLIKTGQINDITLVFLCDKLGRGNQDSNSRIKSVREVNDIVDKLQQVTGLEYENLKKSINEIEKIV